MFEGLTPEQIALIAASLGMPKLLIKLLDVIQQGTGTISEPYFIRKKAEALADGKSYEIKKLTEQFVESQKLLPSIEYKDGQLSIPNKSENDLTLQQRYKNRFEYQQARKQINVENVTANAVEELLSDPEIENLSNDEPIDPDWTARFFETVENVSEEQMQQLWGKVLAGEVKRPKSFSLRTLETLKNISSAEAEIFVKFCNVSVKTISACFVPNFDNFKSLQSNYSISYSDCLLMEEIGLLQIKQNSLIIFGSLNKDKKVYLFYAKNLFVITAKEEIPNADIKAIHFTKVGEELLGLVNINFDEEVANWILTPFLDGKFHVEKTSNFIKKVDASTTLTISNLEVFS